VSFSIIFGTLSLPIFVLEVSSMSSQIATTPCLNATVKLYTVFNSRNIGKKGKASPYSTTERWVPEMIPVLGSQPASDVSHKPGSRLPLLSARLAVTLATLQMTATILLLGEQSK